MASASNFLLRSQKTTNILDSHKAGPSPSCTLESFEETREMLLSTTYLASPHSLPNLTRRLERQSDLVITKSAKSLLFYSDQKVPRSEGNSYNMLRQGSTNDAVKNVLPKYVSVQTLNTESEINFIEENVRQNELLRLKGQRSRDSDCDSDEETQKCSSINTEPDS